MSTANEVPVRVGFRPPHSTQLQGAPVCEFLQCSIYVVNSGHSAGKATTFISAIGPGIS